MHPRSPLKLARVLFVLLALTCLMWPSSTAARQDKGDSSVAARPRCQITGVSAQPNPAQTGQIVMFTVTVENKREEETIRWFHGGNPDEGVGEVFFTKFRYPQFRRVRVVCGLSRIDIGITITP